jgi:hypothetical protein
VSRYFWPALTLIALLAGCESEPRLTPEQWSALETRPIDGTRDDVLRAASAVILDKGYLVRTSDRDAGLVVGVRVPPDHTEPYCRSGGMQGPFTPDVLCVWVRAAGVRASELRLQTRHHFQRAADPAGVAAFCAATERRMLDGAAAPQHASAAGGPP